MRIYIFPFFCILYTGGMTEQQTFIYKLIRDMHAQCGASCSVYKCSHEINGMKHGASLETLLQPSLYRLYQLLFAGVSVNRFIHCSLLHPRGCMHTTCRAQEIVWTAMRTFLSVTISHVILRLHIVHEIIAILSMTHTYIHANIHTNYL